MTSVPKPLKFLREHHERVTAVYESGMDDGAGGAKEKLAELLALLSMAVVTEERLVLKYKLAAAQEVESCGHEFVRTLSKEIGEEYEVRKEADAEADVGDLNTLVDLIFPFYFKNNAEAEAVDLALEVERLEDVLPFVDEENYMRVTEYLVQTANYLVEPDDTTARKVVYDIYMAQAQYARAMRIAILMNDRDLISGAYNAVDAEENPGLKKQLCFILGAARVYLEDDEDDDDLLAYMGNTQMMEHFRALARELDVLEPKTPEDIYKSHLETIARSSSRNVNSARANLASTFVNAFVNAGYGTDKLLTVEDSKWIYQNKDHGMMSAVASLGAIHMWDWESGNTEMNKYMYSSEPYIKAGSMLAVGLVNCGVRDAYDIAYALLEEAMQEDNDTVKTGAILGLALAYAGQNKENAQELLEPLIVDGTASMEVACMASLAIGIIFVGSSNADVTSLMFQALQERSEADLASPFALYMCLGIALVYLGQKEEAEIGIELAATMPEHLQKVGALLIETCAYCGTGNVLKIQKMLHMCSDHLPEGTDATFQAVATIGIAIIAQGEELGSEMALRTFNNLLQYGEIEIKRAVPLALALLHASNPKMTVVDTLSKLSHDADESVAQGAILALGMVGAGSNSARIAAMLRELAAYYSKDPNALFVTRIAQGLLYMGKGTLTLSPFHSDRLLMNNAAMAGLLAVIFSSLNMKETILGKAHYLLFLNALAIRPRMLMTFNEDLEQVFASVRVGDAVDVVGIAGNPKRITGFQTNDAPVLLDYNHRAEFATDEYISHTPILEGVVIVKKNPDFVDTEDASSSSK